MTVTSGTRLGPYEILSSIGAGGMGEVWRAKDTRLGRDVAIKFLPQAVADDPDWLRRFQQEAQTAGTLNHPNLVMIHEFGTDKGAPFIAMELLEGETLRAKLAELATGPRIPIRKAIDYSVQLANGLAAAHEKGIVHRDLKPDNIFITRDGRVKILDFGLAKIARPVDDAPTMARGGTRPGTVLGTVGYMSPEQVRGQDVDYRTDLFSFGAILYEMISGKRAFHGDSAADTMSAILHEDPPELSGSNPNVSPGMDRIIRHCLEKNPEERFQSARDVAFDLQTISGLSGSAPAVHGRSPMESTRWMGLAAACAVGLLIGGGSVALFRRGGTATPAPRTLTQLTFQGGMQRFPSLSPDGKTFLFVSDAAGEPDIYLQRVDGRNAINLTKGSSAANNQPVFSPDGDRIAFRSEREGGGLFVMGATGESVRRLTDFGFNPSWAPDGAEIVFSSESVEQNPRGRSGFGRLSIVDVNSGRVHLLTNHDGVQPSWSPHGNRIAFWGLVGGGGQRDIWTIDPHASDPDKSIVAVTNDRPLDWNPFWSADGKYLYFGSDRDGTLNLWRVRIDEKSGKTEGPLEPLNLPTQFAANFTAARAADVVAFTTIASTDTLERYSFDPAAGRLVGNPARLLSGSLLIGHVSSNGRQIVFGSLGKRLKLYSVNADGTDLRQLTTGPELDRGPSFSRDGSRIFFYSQRDVRYETFAIRPDGSGLTQITRTTGDSLWFPRQSPDGSRLVLYNATGSYIWRLDQSRLEPLPRIDAQHVFVNSSWSPDGRFLVGESVPADNLFRIDGVVLYSIATNKYETISNDSRLTPNTTFRFQPQWLPDGKRIVYAQKNRLIMIDVATKQRRELTASLPGDIQFSLSPDGRSIYIHTRQSEGDIWLMADARGK